MGTQQWYREKRIELIKESQDLLREFLLIPLNKLDSISLSFFENLKSSIQNELSKLTGTQREGIESHICSNDVDATATTIQKNDFFENLKKEK